MNTNWSEWRRFPNPDKCEYLFAPFGFGVYQLRNKQSDEYILFGRGKNVAYRMASLLPKPYGQGVRNNTQKQEYILKHLDFIEYRTIAFDNIEEMIAFEINIKKDKNHLFNS